MAISVIFDGVTVYPPGGSWPIKETHHSRLLKLLHKLGIKPPDTFAFNEGDAFMNADGFDNGIYVVTRAGVLLIGSAGGGHVS